MPVCYVNEYALGAFPITCDPFHIFCLQHANSPTMPRPFSAPPNLCRASDHVVFDADIFHGITQLSLDKTLGHSVSIQNPVEKIEGCTEQFPRPVASSTYRLIPEAGAVNSIDASQIQPFSVNSNVAGSLTRDLLPLPFITTSGPAPSGVERVVTNSSQDRLLKRVSRLEASGSSDDNAVSTRARNRATARNAARRPLCDNVPRGPCIPIQGYTYSCKSGIDVKTAEATVAAIHAFCKDQALRQAAEMLHRLGIDVEWDARQQGESRIEVQGRPAERLASRAEAHGRSAGRPSVSKRCEGSTDGSSRGQSCGSSERSSHGGSVGDVRCASESRKRLHTGNPRRPLKKPSDSDGDAMGALPPSFAFSATLLDVGTVASSVDHGHGSPCSNNRRRGSGGKRSRDASLPIEFIPLPTSSSASKSRRRDLDGLQSVSRRAPPAEANHESVVCTSKEVGLATSRSKNRSSSIGDAFVELSETPMPAQLQSPFSDCTTSARMLSLRHTTSPPLNHAAAFRSGRESDNEVLDLSTSSSSLPVALGSVGASAILQRATQRVLESGRVGLVTSQTTQPTISDYKCAVDVSCIEINVSCEQLFTLFSVYGNVVRVVFFGAPFSTEPSPSSSPASSSPRFAVVVYSLAAAASLACAHLNDLVLHGVPLSVKPSLDDSLLDHLSSLSDATALLADVCYATDPRHRYTGGNRGLGIPRHAVPPSCTLHVANLPDAPTGQRVSADVSDRRGSVSGVSDNGIQERLDGHKTWLTSQISAQFSHFGTVLRVQFPPTGGTRQAFVQLDSVQSAVSALIAMHGSTQFSCLESGSAETFTSTGPLAHHAKDGPPGLRPIAVSFTAATMRPQL